MNQTHFSDKEKLWKGNDFLYPLHHPKISIGQLLLHKQIIYASKVAQVKRNI